MSASAKTKPGSSSTEEPSAIVATGTTGFLGSHFLLARLRRPGRVYALIRGETESAARARLRKRLDVCASSYSLPVLQDGWDRDVRVLLSDVGMPWCGVGDSWVEEMKRDGIAEFWHFAASLDFEDRRRERILRQNVEGTQNALEFARRLGAGRFLYISTAYTVGLDRTERVAESLHTPDRSFNNLYEESKCAAEHTVTNYCLKHGMDYRILRPGIVVGPSESLRPAGSQTGLYGFMRVLYRLKDALESLDHDLTVTGDPDTPIHLIPVDHVNRDIFRLIDSDFAGGPIYHLTGEGSLDVDTVLETVSRHVGARRVRVGQREHEASPLDQLLDRRTAFYGSYFQVRHSFDRSLPGQSRVGVEDLELLCMHYARELREESSERIFERSVTYAPDGTPLNVYQAGDEEQPAVLLVNAYGMPVEFMIPLAQRLASRFRVVTWDSRGVPNLDVPFESERCDLDWHVRDAAAVLKAAGIERAHVVGWCTGAQLALKLTQTCPEKTGSLVLLNGSYASLPEDAAPRTPFYCNMANVMPRIAQGRSFAETYHRLIYGNRAQQSYGSLARASEAAERRTLSHLLEDTDPLLLSMTSVPFRTPESLYRYACMVTRLFDEREDAWATGIENRALCVAGERDTISHPDATLEVARRLARSEVLVLKDGDHFSHYNDEELARVVIDFLASGREEL